MKRENLDFPDAIRYLADKGGITYIKTIPQGFICYLSFTGQQYKIKNQDDFIV